MAAPPKTPGIRFLGVIGALLAFIGAFMPWISFLGFSISGMFSIWGILTFVFGLLGMILFLLVKPGKAGMALGGTIMCLLAMMFPALFLAQITSLAVALGASAGAMMELVGFGVYLAIIGGLLGMIGGAITYSKVKGMVVVAVPPPMGAPPGGPPPAGPPPGGPPAGPGYGGPPPPPGAPPGGGYGPPPSPPPY
jgi:hypothetical protein